MRRSAGTCWQRLATWRDQALGPTQPPKRAQLELGALRLATASWMPCGSPAAQRGPAAAATVAVWWRTSTAAGLLACAAYGSGQAACDLRC